MPQHGIDPEFRRMLQLAENAPLLELFEDGIVSGSTMIFPEDSVEGGSQTIGFGHKIQNPEMGEKLASGGAPFDVINKQLDHDIENLGVARARRSVDSVHGQGAFDKFSKTSMELATAMQFNTIEDIASPDGFPRMVDALVRGDPETALRESALDTSKIPGLASRNESNIEYFGPRFQAEMADRQTAGVQ